MQVTYENKGSQLLVVSPSMSPVCQQVLTNHPPTQPAAVLSRDNEMEQVELKGLLETQTTGV